jgi:RNA polymerase-interacting CarD/CdnL/TRCF family regulator
MSEKTPKRKSTPKARAKPPTKKFKADLASLQEWSSTDPTREALNKLIQSNFKDRTIAQSRTAKKAQDLLKSNDLNKFGKMYSRIVSLAKNQQGNERSGRG